jgi:hypothetical protein
MTNLRTVPAALAVLTATMLAWAAPAPAGEFTKFKGSITDVGVQRGPGQVGGVEFRIEGRFFYDGPIDLSSSTLVLHQLFDEEGAGGGGELMRMTDDANFLPFTMVTSSSSEFDEAKYESPSQFRPQMRMQIENDEGEWEFKLKLDRGLMRVRPSLCVFDPDTRKSYTFLTHSFTITDAAGNPPLDMSITQRWECVKEGRYHMRTR